MISLGRRRKHSSVSASTTFISLMVKVCPIQFLREGRIGILDCARTQAGTVGLNLSRFPLCQVNRRNRRDGVGPRTSLGHLYPWNLPVSVSAPNSG